MDRTNANHEVKLYLHGCSDAIPCVGDEIIFYTISFTRVVGVILNGRLLYYEKDE